MLVFCKVYVVVVKGAFVLDFCPADPIHPGGYCDSVGEHLKEVYRYNTKVWIDGMFKIPNKNPKQIQNSRTKKKQLLGSGNSFEIMWLFQCWCFRRAVYEQKVFQQEPVEHISQNLTFDLKTGSFGRGDVELGFTSMASGEPCAIFARCTLRDYRTLPNKSMKKIPRIFGGP